MNSQPARQEAASSLEPARPEAASSLEPASQEAAHYSEGTGFISRTAINLIVNSPLANSVSMVYVWKCVFNNP